MSATESAAECIPTLGPRQRRRRLVVGAVALVLAVAAGILLATTGATRAWRLVLFVPLWSAALGFFQYREKT
jgi:hypothetical protein